MNPLLKKLYLDTEEFVTSDMLKKYCSKLDLDYDDTIKNLVFRGHLLRIFRGIFYVRALNEIKLGKTKYSHLELIAKGLELKKVNDWYFGLHSALKLNNMTHEEFAIDHVINDTLFRANPINIVGYKFKFHKISSKLLTFGVKKKENIRYSDPEKTILDLLYILRYNSIQEERIIMDVSDYVKNISKKKIIHYASYYPKSVVKTLEELV